MSSVKTTNYNFVTVTYHNVLILTAHPFLGLYVEIISCPPKLLKGLLVYNYTLQLRKLTFLSFKKLLFLINCLQYRCISPT